MRVNAFVAVVLACGCNQLFGIHDLGDNGGPNDAPGSDAPPPGDWAFVAVDSGSTCGIRVDGTLWCWGSQPALSAMDETTPTELSTESWKTVSGNGGLACALKADSSLWCWGNGALGNGSQSESSTPLEIDPGPWQSVRVAAQDVCAIRPDQSVWCWGFAYLGNLGALLGPQGPEGYVLTPTLLDQNSYLAVDIDGDSICGVRTDHSLWCAGDLRFAGINTYPNGTFQMVGSGLTTVSLSDNAACGITEDGHADCILEQAPAPGARRRPHGLEADHGARRVLRAPSGRIARLLGRRRGHRRGQRDDAHARRGRRGGTWDSRSRALLRSPVRHRRGREPVVHR